MTLDTETFAQIQRDIRAWSASVLEEIPRQQMLNHLRWLESQIGVAQTIAPAALSAIREQIVRHLCYSTGIFDSPAEIKANPDPFIQQFLVGSAQGPLGMD